MCAVVCYAGAIGFDELADVDAEIYDQIRRIRAHHRKSKKDKEEKKKQKKRQEEDKGEMGLQLLFGGKWLASGIQCRENETSTHLHPLHFVCTFKQRKVISMKFSHSEEWVTCTSFLAICLWKARCSSQSLELGVKYFSTSILVLD